ncbi:ATP-binding protein [Telluribacter sp.]|jgi:ATP-dependent DNA helicase RecG|uniref:ATP-binding protein n=1 Tax=Telluribacter sp. TaxID=1978767 RepID=UPI002E0FD6F2|nr:ATP-binding protein [Telluribacter sp.]
MTAESQNVEWKSSWHNDYLKWICGFANAHGGTIYIGKNDEGQTVGLPDARELLETLPTKIRDVLGIVCDVNLQSENGLNFIEIITKPYSVPVSLRGRYYYRSGSTKVELTGNELNDFLLRKTGKTWDDVVEESATLADIDETSIRQFLYDAGTSGRMPDVSGLSTLEILDKLRLVQGDKIKRAAIILFGKDPNRFYPNVLVKIGRFTGKDEDLTFQEVEEGNLIQLFRTIPEQLNRKFLTRQIDFMGLQRVERGEYPVAAIREMLLNALVHRNYMGSSVQLRVYDHKLTLWNEGSLPEGLDAEALKRTHSSRPRNLIIADACFKAGYIDTWGRGTLKIYNSCKEAGLPEPAIQPMDGGVLVSLYKDHLNEEQLKKLGLNERQIKAVQFVKENQKITNAEFQRLFDVGRSTATRDLKELVEKGVFKHPKIKGAGAFYEF